MRFKGILLAMCLVFCLAIGVSAETSPELEQLMADFMEENNLNENNFSVCYYHTGTGETYRFNEETLMIAASTYKLPLNLYYYDLENQGEIDSNGYIGGIPLSSMHQQTLVWSNNDYAIEMLYNLGNFTAYKNCMRTYFSVTDEELDDKFYYNNYYSTEMMMETLSYLYDNQDDFQEMIGYMKEAQPTQWFASTKGDYEIAHKYGYYDGAINDVGIIYTPQPFLLAVYTQNVTYGEKTLGDICALLTEYTVEHLYVEPEPEPEPEPIVEPEPVVEPEPEPVAELEPVEAPVEEPVALEILEEAPEADNGLTMNTKDYILVISLAAVVFGLGGVVLLVVTTRTTKKYTQETEEDETDQFVS